MARPSTKVLLAEATQDRSAPITAAHAAITRLVSRTDITRLDPAQEQSVHQIGNAADEALATYRTRADAIAADVERTAAAVRRATTIRRAAQVAGLALALLVAAKSMPLALFLLVVVVIGRAVAQRVIAGRVRPLVEAATAAARDAADALGHPESMSAPAAGLHAQADHVYLASLEPTAQVLELQRRQNELQMQQMQQMQAQHQSAMRQQAATMNAMVEEQQATNDALYGSPGIIGQAIRTRNDIKRRKGA